MECPLSAMAKATDGTPGRLAGWTERGLVTRSDLMIRYGSGELTDFWQTDRWLLPISWACCLLATRCRGWKEMCYLWSASSSRGAHTSGAGAACACSLVSNLYCVWSTGWFACQQTLVSLWYLGLGDLSSPGFWVLFIVWQSCVATVLRSIVSSVWVIVCRFPCVAGKVQDNNS
jgi:hypothetical protein